MTIAMTKADARSGQCRALDVLLTDAAVDGTACALRAPGRGRHGVAAGLARRPRPRRAPRRSASAPSWRASRAGAPRCARPSATAASPTRPGSRAGCSGALVQTYLAVGGAVDGLISDADARLARRAPGALRRGQRPRRARAEQLPVVEPDGHQGERRPGRREPRQGRAPLPARLPAPALDGRHERVRSRREPRAHPGLGRAAHRRLRADPVRSRRPDRSARCRCCSRRRRSTSTTCSTSRPGAA